MERNFIFVTGSTCVRCGEHIVSARRRAAVKRIKR